MRDLHRHARLFADADRLTHGVEQPIGFVAHVRRVQAAARPAKLAHERDDLVGLRVAARLVDESRREADGAGGDAFTHPRLHAIELGRGGLARVVAHRAAPHRALADEHGHVAARPHAVDALEVPLEALPRRGIGVGMEAAESHEPRFERDDARSAVADHVRRHALQDLERHFGLEDHRVVVVAVDVDEARRDREPARVDLHVATMGHGAERDDPLAAHADIRPQPGRARAVEHRAAPNHQVEAFSCRHQSLSGPPCAASASAPSTPALSPSAGATMNSSIAPASAATRT